MKALQIIEPGRAEMIDAPMPRAGAGEVVVQVQAVSTCPHWDMHILEGKPMFGDIPNTYPQPPGQPGHEMAGIVTEIGAGITDFSEGDRVTAWRDPGHEQPGCYAEYVAFDPANLIAIPEDGSFQAFAPFELAMCIGCSFLDILNTQSLQGKRVGIAGLGPSGLLAAQFAKAEGAVGVTGLEVNPGRAEAAAHFGVDRVVDPRSCKPGDLAPGDERAFDVSLDCAGNPAAMDYLLQATKEIVAIFAVQREPYTFPPGSEGLKLFGYIGHSRRAAEYAMDKVKTGAVVPGDLIGATMPLSRYNEAVGALQLQEVLKVCFTPCSD